MARSIDSLASEASGPSFRPIASLRVHLAGLSQFHPLSHMSQVVLRAVRVVLPGPCSHSLTVWNLLPSRWGSWESKSGSRTGSKSSKYKTGSGRKTVGLKIQLMGVRKLASTSIPSHSGSKSATGESPSCPLPPGQALDSVSISVHRQCPVQQEPAPVGRDGHEDVSVKMHCPSNLPVRQHCLSSSPMRQSCASSSPIDGHCWLSSTQDRNPPIKLAC